eukprot:9140593-Karenia_brevis.AAC.1
MGGGGPWKEKDHGNPRSSAADPRGGDADTNERTRIDACARAASLRSKLAKSTSHSSSSGTMGHF